MKPEERKKLEQAAIERLSEIWQKLTGRQRDDLKYAIDEINAHVRGLAAGHAVDAQELQPVSGSLERHGSKAK